MKHYNFCQCNLTTNEQVALHYNVRVASVLMIKPPHEHLNICLSKTDRVLKTSVLT